MDLNSVFLLARVIEHKSFSKASKATGIPTSTISRKISQLEESLNIQLLERTTRKLRLTEKGNEFYEQTQPAIYTLLSAEKNIINEINLLGTLRLSIPPGLEKSLLIPLLFAFKEEYPKVCVKVVATGNNLRFVEDGIDVALRLGKLKDSNNIAHTLLEYRHILVASPSYIKQYGAPDRPDDLSNHQLICATNWLNDMKWDFIKDNKMTSLDINESISINHYESMQLAVEKGMGIGELPIINCTESLKHKRLVRILPSWNLNIYGEDKLTLSIIYSSNKYNSKVIKNFKWFCVRYFKHIKETVDVI